MRTAQRKPRYHSDPLPSRRESETPPIQETATLQQSSSQSHLTQKPGSAPFPLTPISAEDDVPVSPRRIIDRYSSSNRREGHPIHPPEKLLKMSDQPFSTAQDTYPESPSPYANTSANANGSSSSSSASSAMPHRIDTHLTRQRHYREEHGGHYYSARTQSPPINTLNHSPSLSSAHSSISSPAPTALPPLLHSGHGPHHSYVPPPLKYSGHSTQGQFQNHFYGQDTVSPPDVFSSSHYPSHHTSGYNVHPQSQHPMHRSPSMVVPSHYQQPVFQHIEDFQTPVFTDDAATKLSDRIRRRCFNCCTTDTATWRRSSLHPGKVLCNKCGLYERTHTRPRPEQFPHKRGPLSTPTFKSRSPPTLPQPQGQGRALPHLSAISHSPQQQQHHNLPPHATHPSLATQYSHPNTLPQIQDWLRGPGRDQPSYSSSHSPTSTRHSQPNPTTRSPPRSHAQSVSTTLPARTLTPSPSPGRSPSPRTTSSGPRDYHTSNS